MRFARRLGQSMLAPMFVVGGLDALRNPTSKAAKAGSVTRAVDRTLGLPDDPVALVRLNGGVQLLGGTLLAIGAFPRVASLALAASLVPTTLAGHRFWEETDAAGRSTQRVQFLKNAAMLGGLFLVAAGAN
jgi:putative oxidoreductase